MQKCTLNTSKPRRVQPLAHPRPLRQLMYPLPVLPLLLIEDCILVLRQHLLLRRHLRLPPLYQLDRALHLRLC